MTHHMLRNIQALYALFKEDDLGHHAAATAYYALFALTPFVIILFSVSSFLFGGTIANTYMANYIQNRFGAEIIAVIEGVVSRLGEGQSGTYALIAGTLIFLYAVIKFFEEIRRIFFRIFKIRMVEKNLIKRTVKQRVFAGIYMIISLSLIVIFTSANIALSAASNFISSISIALLPYFHILQTFATFILSGILFAVLYRIVSGGAVARLSALQGGIIAAAGFILINALFALYIQFSISFHIYGAAGFLIALMLWLYYAALIVFIGAEASKVAES